MATFLGQVPQDDIKVFEDWLECHSELKMIVGGQPTQMARQHQKQQRVPLLRDDHQPLIDFREQRE